MVLLKAGLLKSRPTPVGEALAKAYRSVGAIFVAGDVAAGGDVLAMNVLLDRDAAGRARDIASLKQQVGDCDTSAPLTATSTLSGEFLWRCAHGRVSGSVLLSPTTPARIQSMEFGRKMP